jgi:hypothetical protein
LDHYFVLVVVEVVMNFVDIGFGIVLDYLYCFDIEKKLEDNFD